MNKNYHQNILFVIIIISTILAVIIIIQAGPPIGTTVNNAKTAGAVVQSSSSNLQNEHVRVYRRCYRYLSARYYDAHSGYFVGLHNETIGAPPPPGQNFYFVAATGQKIPGDNARADYIQGYRLGWKDAKKGVFQVDC